MIARKFCRRGMRGRPIKANRFSFTAWLAISSGKTKDHRSHPVPSLESLFVYYLPFEFSRIRNGEGKQSISDRLCEEL